MRKARIAWTEEDLMPGLTRSGWRVIDGFGNEHLFLPVGSPRELKRRAVEARDGLNARGAKRELETRRREMS